MVQFTKESDRDTKVCAFCDGDGRCAKCDGTGMHVVRKGRLGLKREVVCTACEGVGECRLCHGAGVPCDAPAAPWPVRS